MIFSGEIIFTQNNNETTLKIISELNYLLYNILWKTLFRFKKKYKL